MYIFAVADFEQLNQAWNNFKSKSFNIKLKN